VKIEKARGHPIPFGAERWLVVTIHPSLLLRIQDAGARAEALGRFIEDLNIAKRLVSARGVGTRSMERPMQRMASPSVSARKAR